MSYLPIQQLLKTAQIGTTVTVKGWVRTKRESKNAVFIALNDGSTINTIQAVAEAGQLPEETLEAHYNRGLPGRYGPVGRIAGGRAGG